MIWTALKTLEKFIFHVVNVTAVTLYSSFISVFHGTAPGIKKQYNLPQRLNKCLTPYQRQKGIFFILYKRKENCIMLKAIEYINEF